MAEGGGQRNARDSHFHSKPRLNAAEASTWPRCKISEVVSDQLYGVHASSPPKPGLMDRHLSFKLA
eukprot:2487907-Amphidinium_carterae.3